MRIRRARTPEHRPERIRVTTMPSAREPLAGVRRDRPSVFRPPRFRRFALTPTRDCAGSRQP